MIGVDHLKNRKETLSFIFEKYSNINDRGRVADYIPELKKADYNDLSLSILDLKGKEINLGVYDKLFTMQSISKIISLTLAIMDNSIEFVMSRVGFKGSSDPFNSLYKLDLDSINKPENPMLNAGAILTTSLIKGNGDEKLERLLEFIRIITGDENINYNRQVYKSEKNTGNKNKAIAYLLKSKGLLEFDVEESLDVYFKQCSIEINTRNLAKIGAFYANHGRILGVDKFICDPSIIRSVNSIMTIAGMYDYSGEYAALVGIPSKSGVSGGLLGVIPKELGIAIYSPGLDSYGNSLIGYEMIKEISKEFNYSIF